jgi:hypothetical protein
VIINQQPCDSAPPLTGLAVVTPHSACVRHLSNLYLPAVCPALQLVKVNTSRAYACLQDGTTESILMPLAHVSLHHPVLEHIRMHLDAARIAPTPGEPRNHGSLVLHTNIDRVLLSA